MSIKCGHCNNRHATVAEVKACSTLKANLTVMAPAIAKVSHSCEDYDGECMAFMPECPYYKPEYAGHNESIQFTLVDYQQGL